MNTSLLTCIRGARSRLLPAAERELARRPRREFFMGRLRVLSPLVQAPLMFPSRTRLYVPGFPKPNSKYAAVVDELIESGVMPDQIWHPAKEIDSLSRRIWRLMVRLPWAVILIFSVKRRSRNLDVLAIQSILGRELFRRLLCKRPNLLPVIISDVSPSLHMLWSASSVEGNRAIWWQDDYHHIWRLPYMVRAAIVLNEGGLAVATDRLPPENIFRRPTQRPASIRPIPIKPRIGVATNALFNASPRQRAMLARLRRQLGVSRLHLRLHPTSNLAEGSAIDRWLVVAPSDESLEAYAGRLDIVVVGNSAVQLRLVQKGIPVIHVDGLDSLSFDLYGYV